MIKVSFHCVPRNDKELLAKIDGYMQIQSKTVKVEQMNDYIFSDTMKIQTMKSGVNESIAGSVAEISVHIVAESM